MFLRNVESLTIYTTLYLMTTAVRTYTMLIFFFYSQNRFLVSELLITFLYNEVKKKV
jgi:hypothetical protein